jgi:EAL domain-containing protein (putative c-di-GMP-specific phosphodiesterase class I)/GGDEF domain-containing protein
MRSIGRASRYPGFHFALLIIELDRRDPGEAAADPSEVSLAVVRRLQACLRIRETPPTLRNEDLVVPMEDGRFAILLDGLKELGHASVAAERILDELQAPLPLGDRECRLQASAGIALSATGYAQAQEVVRDAETALHRAVLLGGSRCEVFDNGAVGAAPADLRLEADFSGALERGEFLLRYQPIVSLTSGVIVGFEALVRWQHPVLGLIPPLEFIPVTERTGLIVPLGRWVLGEACRQLKAWQRSVPGTDALWVAVNLSSLQFRHPELNEEIAESLRESGLDPRCLVLELTEGMAMENPAAVTAMLAQVRATGVRVSVDDFGTGHSSLAYLRQFPLDTLKIDRSFVRGIEGNSDAQAIFNAVTTMARQLGLHVVVEGIEKEEQLGLVRELDCGFGQGYLFSRPLDPGTAAALLQTGLPLRHQVVQERATESRRVQARRWTYATAAVFAVVFSLGLPRYFVPRAPQTRSAPVAPRTDNVALEPSAVVAGNGAPALAPDPSPIVPSTVLPVAPAALPAAPAVLPIAPAPRINTALTAPPLAAQAPTASARVVHLHRLGNCRGLLVISENGLAFVPDGNDAGDAFSFGHGQFLHALSNEGLTIKSHDRTYRFKSGVVGEGGSLEALVASIARFR